MRATSGHFPTNGDHLVPTADDRVPPQHEPSLEGNCNMLLNRRQTRRELIGGLFKKGKVSSSAGLINFPVPLITRPVSRTLNSFFFFFHPNQTKRTDGNKTRSSNRRYLKEYTIRESVKKKINIPHYTRPQFIVLMEGGGPLGLITI